VEALLSSLAYPVEIGSRLSCCRVRCIAAIAGKSPALAIFVAPVDGPPVDDASLRREVCAKAFEKGVPSSRIVRPPGAAHHVFLSNAAEVQKEIRDFVGGLKN
jgi:hypothetical protein